MRRRKRLLGYVPLKNRLMDTVGNNGVFPAAPVLQAAF